MELHPLRELRKSLGLNQRQFAGEVGLHPTYVSQLETGSEPVGKTTALRIADRYRLEMARLGITIEDLMRGSRARPDPAGAAA
jgi:transcriptional regulator with XRE-family HTH domain